MGLCKICNELNCKNYLCQKAIEYVKNRIEKQKERYRKTMNINKECVAEGCTNKVLPLKRLCNDCKEERRINRRNADIERRRKKRVCKNVECGKDMPRSATNAQKYCSKDCKPKKAYVYKQVKKKVVKVKKEKKYNIDPKWLVRGNISITGERMFGHGKSITRL